MQTCNDDLIEDVTERAKTLLLDLCCPNTITAIQIEALLDDVLRIPIQDLYPLINVYCSPIRTIICTIIVKFLAGNHNERWASQRIHEKIIKFLSSIDVLILSLVSTRIEVNLSTSTFDYLGPNQLFDYLEIFLSHKDLTELTVLEILSIIHILVNQNTTHWFTATLRILPKILQSILKLLKYPNEIDENVPYINFEKDSRCLVRNMAGLLIETLSDRFPNSLASHLSAELKTHVIDKWDMIEWKNTESIIFAFGCMASGIRLPFEPLNNVMNDSINAIIDKLSDVSKPLLVCSVIFTIAKLCRFYGAYYCLNVRFNYVTNQILSYMSHCDPKIRSISLKMTKTLAKRMMRSHYENHSPERMDNLISTVMNVSENIIRQDRDCDIENLLKIVQLLLSGWNLVQKFYDKLIKMFDKIYCTFIHIGDDRHDRYIGMLLLSLSSMTFMMRDSFLPYLSKYYSYCLFKVESTIVNGKCSVDAVNEGFLSCCMQFVTECLEWLESEQATEIILSKERCKQIQMIISYSLSLRNHVIPSVRYFSYRIIGNLSKRRMLNSIIEQENMNTFIFSILLPSLMDDFDIHFNNDANVHIYIHYPVCTLGIIIMNEISVRQSYLKEFENNHLKRCISILLRHLCALHSGAENSMNNRLSMLYMNVCIVLARLGLLFTEMISELFVTSDFGEAFVLMLPHTASEQDEMLDCVSALIAILEWHIEDNMQTWKENKFEINPSVVLSLRVLGSGREHNDLFKKAGMLAKIMLEE